MLWVDRPWKTCSDIIPKDTTAPVSLRCTDAVFKTVRHTFALHGVLSFLIFPLLSSRASPPPGSSRTRDEEAQHRRRAPKARGAKQVRARHSSVQEGKDFNSAMAPGGHTASKQRRGEEDWTAKEMVVKHFNSGLGKKARRANRKTLPPGVRGLLDD